MSPLEAVREMVESPPTYSHDISPHVCPNLDEGHEDCHYCDAPILGSNLQVLGPHAEGCPWLAMPQIVAALEAAEKAVALWGNDMDLRADYDAMASLDAALKGSD